jgi:hypothetical protein
MSNTDVALLDVQIEKTKSEINDTSIGLSMLTIFFLALIPLFYSIIGIYNFTLKDIEIPLVVSVTIIFMATMLTIVHWENNTKRLGTLYAQKEDLLRKQAFVEAALEAERSKNKK